MRLRTFFLVVLALVFLMLAGSAHADGIIGTDLSTFAILGGAGVAVNGTGSVVVGSVGGCCSATAVTGFPADFTISGGTVQMGGAVATSAQNQLTTSVTALGGMTPNSSVSTLGGLTLTPGVYSSSSTMNLTGTLTLDGQGNANALWVFIVGSSLTTASSSTVNVINTGSGAGVYWVMPAGSATLGSNSTFEGNILANQSITLSTGVTDSCGRLLTQVASVTLAGTDTVGIGCSGLLAASNGLSGGGTLSTGPTGIPVITPATPASVPEPGTFALLLSALLPMGLVTFRKLRA